MAEYSINRGIDRPAEFKGLKSQYLFIFVGGLLGIFVVFVIMYLMGIGQWICIGFGVISACVLVYFTFSLNAKYGTHGMMKLSAGRNHPRFIINRKAISGLFTYKSNKVCETY